MVPVDPGSFGHATKFNSLTDSFLTRHIYRSFDNTLRSVFPGNVGLLIYIGNEYFLSWPSIMKKTPKLSSLPSKLEFQVK